MVRHIVESSPIQPGRSEQSRVEAPFRAAPVKAQPVEAASDIQSLGCTHHPSRTELKFLATDSHKQRRVAKVRNRNIQEPLMELRSVFISRSWTAITAVLQA